MTTTARTTPVGQQLDDGYSTKIAFLADPDVSFWEKTVTPPGVDGGDAIETTTMFNATWRTMSERQLKTLTDASSTVAYDPLVFDQIVALINVRTEITIHFPNADTLDFWGFLRTFEINEHSEGEQPTANVTITPVNQNASNVETGPTFTTAP